MQHQLILEVFLLLSSRWGCLPKGLGDKMTFLISGKDKRQAWRTDTEENFRVFSWQWLVSQSIPKEKNSFEIEGYLRQEECISLLELPQHNTSERLAGSGVGFLPVLEAGKFNTKAHRSWLFSWGLSPWLHHCPPCHVLTWLFHCVGTGLVSLPFIIKDTSSVGLEPRSYYLI